MLIGFNIGLLILLDIPLYITNHMLKSDMLRPMWPENLHNDVLGFVCHARSAAGIPNGTNLRYLSRLYVVSTKLTSPSCCDMQDRVRADSVCSFTHELGRRNTIERL